MDTRPTVVIYKNEKGYGYLLNLSDFKIKQDHAPAMSGMYWMSEFEATILGNYVADKIESGLPWSVSVDQIISLWNGTKSSSQLISEEKNG